MVKFEFTVNDSDAENIMGIMMEAQNNCDLKILDEMCGRADPKTIQWYTEHKEYLKNLRKKMKNFRVN